MLVTFLTNSLYSVFLTSTCLTRTISLLKSTGVFSNLPISNFFYFTFQTA